MLKNVHLNMVLDKIASTLCIKIWNQYFTCMRIWYQLFKCVIKLLPILHICENWVPILHTQETSSPKDNDRSSESHYKTMGTFKILKGS